MAYNHSIAGEPQIRLSNTFSFLNPAIFSPFPLKMSHSLDSETLSSLAVDSVVSVETVPWIAEGSDEEDEETTVRQP